MRLSEIPGKLGAKPFCSKGVTLCEGLEGWACTSISEMLEGHRRQESTSPEVIEWPKIRMRATHQNKNESFYVIFHKEKEIKC